MELDAITDLHRQNLALFGPGPFGGELRDDLHVLVDIDKLVAHRGIDDAADKGARLGRIQHVRVVVETDA
ncbi:hypothetical protein D3C86_2018150 [compost metagenome]